MSAGVKKVVKGGYLFRENDPSDAMYVIKKGRLTITKAKGSKEIVLAELGPGEMLGEMAFFANNPRSAGAKAAEDSEAIALPFTALHAQFKTFPEWLKAMVKTVNTHLRMANQRIKNLESTDTQEDVMFPPHSITKFCAIIDKKIPNELHKLTSLIIVMIITTIPDGQINRLFNTKTSTC